MNKKPNRAAPRTNARSDDANAFLRDPFDGGSYITNDALAEELAEEFVGSATSGQEQGEEARDQLVTEEIGGPFVTSSATREFAQGIDGSNPLGAEPAAFPTTNARIR